MTDEFHPFVKAIPKRLKQAIATIGAVLTLFGLPPAINLFCIVPFTIFGDAANTPSYVLLSLVLVLVTTAAGGVTFYHADRSLHEKPSKPLRLPSPLLLMDIFGVLLIAGILVTYGRFALGLFIPPLVFVSAALPPLWTVSWFIGKNEDDTARLTWRRALTTLAGGASAGLFIAIVLEALLPLLILVLGADLLGTVMDSLDAFFSVLGRAEWNAVWPAMLNSPGFIYVLLQFTLIAPLVEEFAKPLVTIPVLRHLNRQEAFWVGAIVGAGFAILENNIYATIGMRIWLEFLFVRALGSAIQPLGSGLVTLGWQDVLRNEPGAWMSWARRFGVAVVIHAAWNAATLLVIFLGEMFFMGNFLRNPSGGIGFPEIGALGMLLVFLILLGSTTMWAGRKIARGKTLMIFRETQETQTGLSNRTIAIWALGSIMIVLPAGIILTRLWLR